MFWSMEKTFLWAGKKDLRTYGNIRKIETGQGDDYTAGCFLVIEEAEETILDFSERTLTVL